MTTTIKIRRDTAANWTATNPILASGEPGLETDTLAVKYGDGVTAWNDLLYGTVETAITVSGNAQANITSVGTLTNLSVAGNVNTANLTATGNVALTGANVSLGSVANLHIAGGTANYVLSTDGAGNLAWKVDATNNMGNIVIDGDNIGSSNDIVNITASNYVEMNSWGTNMWVEQGAAYVNTLDGEYQWSFNSDGTTSFPNYTVLSDPFGPGQFFTTQRIPNLQSNITNINPDEDNIVIVSKTDFPDINLVNSGWTLYYNGYAYPVSSVVDGDPVADNFYIILGDNPAFGPAGIPQGAYVQVGLKENHTWWFDFEGTTAVPGNININTINTFSINGAPDHGASLNSDSFAQLYWVPNIQDQANVDPDNGGNIYNWGYVDHNGFWVAGANIQNDTSYVWNFTNTGNLQMPDTTRLNSGGIGRPNSAEFGTEIVTGPANYVWWDRYKKGSGIYIAGEDLALSVYSNANVINAHSILSINNISYPDKSMFSFTINQVDSDDYSVSVGAGNEDTIVNGLLGTDTFSIGMTNAGFVYINGNPILNNDPFSNGDTVDIAIDRTNNNLIWFRVNNGSWNSDGAANPSTGVGGADISGIIDTLYPAVSLGGIAVVTANRTAPHGVPAGYTFIHPVPAQQGNVVKNSQIYMGSGTGEGRIITDTFGNSLAYFGTENVGLPGFAGMVSSDPDVTSQYQIGTDDGDNIIIGATTQGGELTSSDYRAALGVLNANLTINGFYSDTFGAIMSGGGANNSSTIWAVEEGIGITNVLYPREDAAIDIGTYDKSFDSIYVNSIKTKNNLNINTADDYSFWYSLYGDLGLNDIAVGFNSGAAYDQDGNLYVMGIYLTQNEFDTLALKYNPNGDLVWRKAWIDTNSDNPCGSWNREFSINNTGIYWMAVTDRNDVSSLYVGSMNTDGVITTAATKVQNVVGNDMIAIDTNVYVVGRDGTGTYPMIMKVDTTTNAVIWSKVLTDYEGSFDCIIMGNDGNLYTSGFMIIGGDDYPIVSKFQTNGTYVVTKNINDGAASGHALALAADGNDIYVTYTLQSIGGYVVTKISTSSNLTASPIWGTTVGLGSNLTAYDISVDDNGYVYVTGAINNGPGDFYAAKLDDMGKVVWQRRIGGNSSDGPTTNPNNARMAGIYNDRLAITGYTQTDPYTGAYSPPHSITFQIPTNGSTTGNFGNFYIYPEYYSIGYNYSQTYLTVAITGLVTTLPTYSNNNGFIPSTILKNPNYVPYRNEIAPGAYNGWKFDTSNNLVLPHGGKITGNSDGSIEIYPPEPVDGNLNGVYLYDGTGNSAIDINQYNVRIGVNTNEWNHYWDFSGDNYGISKIRYPYLENYDVQKFSKRINALTTDTIWIAQDTTVTGAKLTINMTHSTDGTDYESFDTMVCEIAVAVKKVGYGSTRAVASVYGITHTSDEPLGTFEAGIIPGGTYNNVAPSSTSGSGINAQFNISTNANYGYYTINNIPNGGTGYDPGDIIIISGADVGGFDGENNITIIVNSTTGSGVISTAYVSDGFSYAGRVYVTCTTLSTEYYSYVKVQARESGSSSNEYYC
jgi:hypothetical protein